MDTELARTFLTVIDAGNFINAAERLHVTQSTVSARIHSLEEQLGCKLFVRNKAGTTLTTAGHQFQKHAAVLVRTVEHARQDVGISRGYRASLTVGGRFGLWERLLSRWLPLMRRAAPDTSVRAEIGFEADLMQGLIDGRLDIGVMYTPQSRPGLIVERLLEENLVMVASRPSAPQYPGGDAAAEYVYVDWGPEFYAAHNAQFPDFVGAGITANIGWLGMQHVLQHGGSGYFPVRLVEPYLQDGRLHLLPDAPAFPLPAYLVYSKDADMDVLASALDGIRAVAAEYA